MADPRHSCFISYIREEEEGGRVSEKENADRGGRRVGEGSGI